MEYKKANTRYINNYKKGNATESLKKRFHIFYVFIFLVPLAGYILLFLYKKNEMQSLDKKIKELNRSIEVKTTHYRNMKSTIDRLVGFQEVKKYAINNLKMVDVENEVELFVVVDKNSVFIKEDSTKKPESLYNNENITMNR